MIPKTRSHYLLYIAVLCVPLLLAGCSEKILDYRNAEIVNGKVYAQGSNKPFSGKFTNLGYREAPGLSDVMDTYASDAQTAAHIATRWIGVKCDVQIKEGVLNGPGVCTLPGSDVLFSEFTYKAGVPDGDVTYYDQSKDNRTLVTGTVTNGQFDGEQKVFNPASKKLVMRVGWKNGRRDGVTERHSPDGEMPFYKAEWQNGQKNGIEETFSADNGKLLTHQEWKDGSLSGEIRKYTPDGSTLVYKGHASNNLRDDVEEEYDPRTGKMLGHAEWKMGQLDGVSRRWDAAGNLINDQRFQNGVLVEDRLKGATPGTTQVLTDAIGGNSNTSCVDTWTAAHRKAVGPDPLITTGQLDEWAQWCAQGKKP